MNSLKQEILTEVMQRSGSGAALSDEIWSYAELGYQEHRTVAAQIAWLEAEGFRIERNVAGISTAFWAEAGEGGPLIGILGEFDALANLSQVDGALTEQADQDGQPGHGCGHHLLGTGSMLAAAAVHAVLKRHGIPGRVRYYGCPAEEGGSGKVFMARDGAFDDLDVCFSWHANSVFAMHASDTLAIKTAVFHFRGRASHAAVSPHLGRSALDAVELMNVGVNYMREHMLPEARVHYAMLDGGGHAANVVQANAVVGYTIRAPEMSDAEELFDRIVRVAQGAAMMSETHVEVSVKSGLSNVLTNSTLEKVMFRNITQVVGPVQHSNEEISVASQYQETISETDVIHACKVFAKGEDIRTPLHQGIVPFDGTPTRVPVSTDAGDVSWIVPLARCFGPCYAVGTPFHSWQMVAQGKLSYAHKGMFAAAKAIATTVIDVIETPDLIVEARTELDRKRRGRPWVCPLPADLQPQMAEL
ncbi:amidohydrolase [Microvirga sp. M2]|uniref:amidohydrolase n=1 Tax=Microvirga sp. M2 TaxID=3073270 RepID=UPI0039C2970C